MQYLDGIFLYMFIVIHFISLMVSSVTWDIQSEEIIIGEDVILNCNGTSCSAKRTKKWIGGPDYEVLSFGNDSTNPFKYGITGDTLLNYGLKIKKISFDDFNHIYTCACGLQHYSEKLNLHDVNYTYPPHIEEKKIDKYRLQVKMEVYPLAKCRCHFKNETQSVNNSITVKSKTYKTNLDGSPTLYKVWISLYFRDLQFIDCKGYVDIYCDVRLLNYTIIRHHFDMCKGESDVTKFQYVLIVIASIIGLPLCYCCTVLSASSIKNLINFKNNISCKPCRKYVCGDKKGIFSKISSRTWKGVCRCRNDDSDNDSYY